MKKYVLSLLALIIVISAASAQAFRADDPEGTVIQCGYLNKKGKKVSEMTMTLIDKSKAEDGGSVLHIREEMYIDGKPHRVDMKMTYTNTQMILNKSVFFTNTIMTQAKQYDDWHFDVAGDDPVLPLQMSVGDELPNYTLTLLQLAAPNVIVTTVAKTTARKIVRQEEVSVTAGTFEAYVLEEISVAMVEVPIIGNISSSAISTSWIVPGMGIVKQVSANIKGKMQSGLELLSINRPE